MVIENRGYCGIGLDNVKYAVNVGATLRAAGVYGASFVTISGKRYKVSATDTMKSYRHLPLHRVDNVMDFIPYVCVPVAVDLVEGATPLPEYQHPERAFYIFGAEDNTLGARVLDKCRDRVYIPTNGCMNLAATVNVVLYDRLSKEKT
jgi:tRNA(Leu) C34 or U34 (ribose-2'-O)-methylase TrmL